MSHWFVYSCSSYARSDIYWFLELNIMLVYDVLGDAAFQKLWQGFVGDRSKQSKHGINYK